MSGNQKLIPTIDLSKEVEVNKHDYTLFNLEKDESFPMIFNEHLLNLEPEDHFENLFRKSASPEVYVKMQEEEVKYAASIASGQETEYSLSSSYQDLKKLQDKCRLIQQIIFATSKDPIYDYSIGFESDDEMSIENEDTSFFVSERESDESVKIKEEIKQPDILRHQLKSQEVELPMLKDLNQQRYATLITISDAELSPIISETIELTLNCQSTPLPPEEKRRFLKIFDHLECMRRGLVMKMTELNDNDHRCKFCGLQFQSGRKLGGHVSRKHPGNSYEYHLKKEVQRNKACQRNRRKYFKHQRARKNSNLLKMKMSPF